MNLQDIEKEMLSNLNLSTMTEELTNMTNSYAEPSFKKSPQRHHSSSDYHYHSGYGERDLQANGVGPRTRGYSSSSTESGASSNRQYKSSTLPRNHSSSHSSSNFQRSSQPNTPRSSKKSYDSVPSSGYGKPSPRKSVQSSGYGQQQQPCKVHESPGYRRKSTNQVQSSGYGQTTPRTEAKRNHQRSFSTTSSGYGTSGGDYSRSPANVSNFTQMRNSVGYRSLRVPSKTSQMYQDEYGSPQSPQSPQLSHRLHELSFDQQSNASDPLSDTASVDSNKINSRIPVYHRPNAPAPLKPPPDSRLPVKVSSPEATPNNKSLPFQRSRSLRKW